jgi:hypothetical protein
MRPLGLPLLRWALLRHPEKPVLPASTGTRGFAETAAQLPSMRLVGTFLMPSLSPMIF